LNIRGWIYVISNEAMPGLLKIGFSTKDPQLRARELANTGSPHPYVVEYDALVNAPHATEQRIHKALAHVREGKEWFRCAIPEAIAAARDAANEVILESARNQRAHVVSEADCSRPNTVLKGEGTLPPKPLPLPHAQPNRSARWHWCRATQVLTEKGGHRRFGPRQFTYDGDGQIRGFAVRDSETPWIALEDVEFLA
jgi:hypothetical protein